MLLRQQSNFKETAGCLLAGPADPPLSALPSPPGPWDRDAGLEGLYQLAAFGSMLGLANGEPWQDIRGREEGSPRYPFSGLPSNGVSTC